MSSRVQVGFGAAADPRSWAHSQVRTDGLGLSVAPTQSVSSGRHLVTPTSPPGLTSAVAAGQPTGHFHIQFVSRSHGSHTLRCGRKAQGSLLTPPAGTVRGGFPCSFLPVPLDEAGVGLSANPGTVVRWSRETQARAVRLSGHQPGAGRGDLKLTWKRGEGTAASGPRGPSPIHLVCHLHRAPAVTPCRGVPWEAAESHRMFRQGQGQG